jgi:hypothetical protein
MIWFYVDESVSSSEDEDSEKIRQSIEIIQPINSWGMKVIVIVFYRRKKTLLQASLCLVGCQWRTYSFKIRSQLLKYLIYDY